jgi:hypothetical protein
MTMTNIKSKDTEMDPWDHVALAGVREWDCRSSASIRGTEAYVT